MSSVPVNDLYNTALDELKDGNNTRAAAAFQEVERQHPYSQWATRGQLMAAYAFYKAGEYDQAIDAARRFIDLHPGHKDVPYAHYLDRHQLLRSDLRCRPRSEDDRACLQVLRRAHPPFPG